MNEKIKKILDYIKISVEVIIFIAAIFFIHKELKRYSINDLKETIHNMPLWTLFLIILITVIDYLILTGFDLLAFEKEKIKFSKLKTMFTSFISFSFSNSIGLSGLTASGIRINLYSAWGVPYKSIINITIFCYITYWLGLLWIGGIFLTFLPVNLTNINLPKYLPITNTLFIGIGLLIGAIIFSFFHYKKYNGSIWTYFLRIILALGDWVAISSILYLGLFSKHSHMEFLHFLSIFIIAQILGVLSNVPGGIGVFDLTCITLLQPYYSSEKIIGALLIYRLIYFFVPLLIGFIAFGFYHLSKGKSTLQMKGSLASKYVFSLFPLILSFFIFIGGALLIISGSIPPSVKNLDLVQEFFPLITIQFSHFVGSIVGTILLILAYGIKRRLDSSYYLAIIFLILGIIASLIKDFDIKSALGLLFILMGLIPAKEYFYRRSSIFSEKLSKTWMLLVGITVLLGIYIGIFSHQNSIHLRNIFFNFDIYKETPKFLRATLGIFLVLFTFLILRILKPAKIENIVEPTNLKEKVNECIETSSDTTGYLAYLQDKEILFEPDEESFIMFAKSGNSFVAMGDPIGKKESFGDAIWTFYNYCKKNHMQTVFYEISKENLNYYLDIGLSFLKIGECAKVDLQSFTLEGSEAKKLRYTYNKFTKEGFEFEVIPKEKVPDIIEDLKNISDEWLADKNAKEKGFSLGKFTKDYVLNFPIAIVKKDNKILAFSNLLMSKDKHEITLDLMRYRNEAPSGTMEFCFICMLLYGKNEGFAKFNLGMAPLSGIEKNTASFWNKLEHIIFSYGKKFYNFQGLRAFKEKFNPEWEPKYIAYSGPINLPKVITDVTLLISGGVKGLISKK